MRFPKWTRKPPVNAKLNLGHRLAVGLYDALLFNEGFGSVRSIFKSNSYALATNATWKMTPSGYGVDIPGSADGSGLDSVAGPTATAVTWMALVTADTSGLSYSMFISHVGTNQHELRYNAVGQLDLIWNYPAVGFSFVTDATTVPVGTPFLATATYDGSNLTLYKNDKSVGVPQTGVSYDGAATSVRIGGRQGDNSFPWDGAVHLVYFWNRALTQAEIAWLYQDPYAFIIREDTSSILYNLKAAAAAGDTQEWMSRSIPKVRQPQQWTSYSN